MKVICFQCNLFIPQMVYCFRRSLELNRVWYRSIIVFFGIVILLGARLTCVVFAGRLMIIFVFIIWRSKLVCCWTVLCENGYFKDGIGIGNRLDSEFFLGICKVVLVGLLRFCKWIREERFLRKVLFFYFVCFESDHSLLELVVDVATYHTLKGIPFDLPPIFFTIQNTSTDSSGPIITRLNESTKKCSASDKRLPEWIKFYKNKSLPFLMMNTSTFFEICI